MGKTILESYAEGRAVVASDLGSRRELIQDGETGLLYRTGDVNQLAEAIRLLGSSPEVAEKMGRAGWEMVRERHMPRAHYQKLLDVYEGLVARNASRKRVIAEVSESPRRPLRTESATAVEHRRLRVAFIGGRGVISKYSGIETYYEEVGKRLVRDGA